MFQSSIPWLDEAFWAQWKSLKAALHQRQPTPADRPVLEKVLLSSSTYLQSPWRWQIDEVLCGTGAIMGLAVDPDSRAVYVLRRDGEVQVGWPGRPERAPLRLRLPAATSRRLMGLATYRNYWGRLQVGVVTLETDVARLYDILLVTPSDAAMQLELRLQTAFPPDPLALWPQWAGNYPTYRLKVLAGAPSAGPRSYRLVAEGLTLAASDKEGEIPFCPQVVIGDEQAIFVAGRYEGVIRFAAPSAQSPTLTQVDAWKGKGKVPGCITALARYPGAAGQVWLLVATEEGYLYTLDYHTGAILGGVSLPARPYSLAVGDLNGDGQAELLVGCHDGRLIKGTPPIPTTLAHNLIDEFEPALAWALQTGSKPEDVILAWVRERQPPLVLAALRDWEKLTGRPLADMWHCLLYQTSSRDVEFLLAYYNQHPPDASLVANLTAYLRTSSPSLPPAIWRQISRLPGAMEQMPTADPLTTHFAQWIDAQQGVRLIRRCSLSEPVTALTVQSAAGAMGVAWLATQSGQLMMVDLAQRHVSQVAQLASPLVALSPAADDVQTVWGLTADGKLVAYRADQADPYSQQVIMRAGWALSSWGQEWLVSGDSGVARFDSHGDGQLHFLAPEGHAYHSCWLADANGSFYLALAEPAAAHFSLRRLTDHHTVQVALPAPLVQLVAWPMGEHERLPLAVCADQQIYLFDLQGELRWQRSPEVSGLRLSPPPVVSHHRVLSTPAVTFFDFNEQQPPELWVTAHERVVVYGSDGERLGEFGLETTIHHLAVVPWRRADGRLQLGLVVVSARHELQLFEVLDYRPEGQALAQRLLQAIEEEVQSADPVVYWQAEMTSGRPSYRVEMALSRLADLANAPDATVARRAQDSLTTFQLPADAPTDHHIGLAQALLQVAASQPEQAPHMAVALQRCLQLRDPYPRLHQALALQVDRLVSTQIPQPLSPPWVAILEGLVCDDPVTSHGYTCIVTSVVFGAGQADPGWWTVLRALTDQAATTPAYTAAYVAARRAVAHRLLDVFRDGPCHGWRFMHQLFEHGIHPGVLQRLTSTEAPCLTNRPNERATFQAVQDFMLDPTPQRLSDLTQCLTQLKSELTPEVCARFYFDLNALTTIQQHEELERFFLERTWSVHFGPYLDSPDDDRRDVLLRRVIPELEKVLLRLRRGLEEVRASSSQEQRLERLRALVSVVEAGSRDLKGQGVEARTAGHYATAAWLTCLGHLWHQWSQPDGLFGQWISHLSNDFIFQLELSDLRFRNEELQATVTLANVGLAPGANLKLEACQLYLDERYYPGEWEPAWPEPGPNLEAHKRLKGQLRFVLPLASTAQEAILRVEISYIQDSRQRKEYIVSIRLPTQRERLDYARLFPAAWKAYSAEVRQGLRQPGRVVLLELDRTARRSFLESWRAEAPVGVSQIVNLRQVYSQLRGTTTHEGRPTRLRAEDIHQTLAQLMRGTASLEGWGADYRRHFHQALQTPHQPITTLILDRFDYFLLKLLADADGREALAETLGFWAELVQTGKVRLILGCSFLTLCILRARYPDFMAQCVTVRPNYLLLTPAGRREALAFLEQQLRTRGLEVWLGRFKQPLEAGNVAELCGYNLLFMRLLALEGLEQAQREAEDSTIKRDLSTITLTQYLLEYGHGLNFFRLAWVWFDFYDKIALSLLAQAEFAVEKQSWLDDLEGMTLTRPYFPGTPRGRSRRPEAQVGDLLTPRLMDKVRSSRHFAADDLWLSGFVSRQPVAFGAGEHERVASMFLRLLRVHGWEALLSRLVRENKLLKRSAGRELGDIYVWRIPLWREFFAHYQLLDHCIQAAVRGESEWYPRTLHQHSRTGEPLYEVDPGLQPVHRAIPLEDWPALDDALGGDREERYWWLNFLGLGGQRLAQWTHNLALANGLLRFAHPDQTLGDAEVRAFFEHFNRALGVGPAPASLHGALHHRLTSWGGQAAGWQVTSLGDHSLPGMRPYFLIGVIAQGNAWRREIVEEAHRQVTTFWEAIRLSHEQPDPAEKVETRPGMVVLIVPQAAAALRERLEQVNPGVGVRYVVLDKGDLAELLTAPLPGRQLVRLCQRQVGRAALSPYQSRGPLAPGSQLFVGRQEQLKRILELVGRTPALIFGSRRIGKTSLLRQIQGTLTGPTGFLPLWIAGSGLEKVTTFFDQLRLALRQAGYGDDADSLGADEAGYTTLQPLLAAMRQRDTPLPVLLLDEVDDLYRLDRQQGEHLFQLLRNLVQHTPPLCGLVMTGYRQIFLRQHDQGSVFFNFGEAFFLREVEDSELIRLINLLKTYEVTFYNQTDAQALLLEGTYRIPYLMQTACLHLLRRLDNQPRPDPNRLELEDVEIVLAGQVEAELMDDLIRKILVEGDTSSQAQALQLKLRILLYALVLGKYGHTLERGASFRPLTPADRYFTVEAALRYLRTWADPIPWTYEETDNLLQELRMTLAIGAEEGQRERLYYFAQDIVPRLLYRYYQREERGNLIDDLAYDLELYVASSQ